MKSIQQQSFAWGLPWWFSGPLVKNSPANVGDMGSIPGVGMKNPQAAGQLSACAVTADACAPRARSMRGQHERTAQQEACALHLGSSSRSPGPEKACTHSEDPGQPETNKCKTNQNKMKSRGLACKSAVRRMAGPSIQNQTEVHLCKGNEDVFKFCASCFLFSLFIFF